MASNNVFNKLKKKELTDDERIEMREKFADVSKLGATKSNSCKTSSFFCQIYVRIDMPYLRYFHY